MPGRRDVLVLLTLAVAAGARPGSVNATQQLRQRTIAVSVLGRSDLPVSDLAERDFSIKEDGVQREILRVAPAAPPTHVVLLIDDSSAAASNLRELRSTLNTFTDRLTEEVPAPAVRLTTFGDRPTVVTDFSPTFSAVSRGIDRLQPRQGAGAMFLDAIIETCRDLRTRRITGATLVAFVAEEGPEFSNARARTVADALRGVGAGLWTVTLQDRDGAGGLSDSGRERAMVIGDVTTESGGRNAVILSDQNLPQAFEKLAQQLFSRYEVTYGRPEAMVPPTKIEVTVRDRSWKVQASKWPAE